MTFQQGWDFAGLAFIDSYSRTGVARHLAPALRAGDTWWEWDIPGGGDGGGQRLEPTVKSPGARFWLPSPVHSGQLPGLGAGGIWASPTMGRPLGCLPLAQVS